MLPENEQSSKGQTSQGYIILAPVVNIISFRARRVLPSFPRGELLSSVRYCSHSFVRVLDSTWTPNALVASISPCLLSWTTSSIGNSCSWFLDTSANKRYFQMGCARIITRELWSRIWQRDTFSLMTKLLCRQNRAASAWSSKVPYVRSVR